MWPALWPSYGASPPSAHPSGLRNATHTLLAKGEHAAAYIRVLSKTSYKIELKIECLVGNFEIFNFPTFLSAKNRFAYESL